jgi:hypothetical protein
MVLARAGGHRPALANDDRAHSPPATATITARATIGSVGRLGGSTSSATDTTALRASSAVRAAFFVVRAASGGACLGASAMDTPVLHRPRYQRCRRWGHAISV